MHLEKDSTHTDAGSRHSCASHFPDCFCSFGSSQEKPQKRHFPCVFAQQTDSPYSSQQTTSTQCLFSTLSHLRVDQCFWTKVKAEVLIKNDSHSKQHICMLTECKWQSEHSMECIRSECVWLRYCVCPPGSACFSWEWRVCAKIQRLFTHTYILMHISALLYVFLTQCASLDIPNRLHSLQSELYNKAAAA